MVNLELFCWSGDRCRFDTEKPFVQGGWRYATDGKILVRQWRRDAAEARGRRLPNMAAFVRLYADLFRRIEKRRPWPPFDEAGRQYTCTRCWGLGTDVQLCPVCRGEGRLLPTGKEQKCPTCTGMGLVSTAETLCRDCEGRTCCRLQTVLGEMTIAEPYWRLIAALPGVYLIEAGGKREDPVLFGWTGDGGGDGIVYQMRLGEEPEELRL